MDEFSDGRAIYEDLKKDPKQYLKIFEGFMWGVVMLVVLVIGLNAGKTEAKKQADAAYKQGYKDALYKRPVSDDLEMVCAGLWIGEQNRKIWESERAGKH